MELILSIINIVLSLIMSGMFFVILIILVKIDNNLLDREHRDKKLTYETLKLMNKIIEKLGIKKNDE